MCKSLLSLRFAPRVWIVTQLFPPTTTPIPLLHVALQTLFRVNYLFSLRFFLLYGEYLVSPKLLYSREGPLRWRTSLILFFFSMWLIMFFVLSSRRRPACGFYRLTRAGTRRVFSRHVFFPWFSCYLRTNYRFSYVRSGIHQSHLCEIEEHFLGSEATWFLSPHLDLVFFFFFKKIYYTKTMVYCKAIWGFNFSWGQKSLGFILCELDWWIWSLGSIDHDHWPNEMWRDEPELPEVLHLLYHDANVSIQYHYSTVVHIQDKPDACIFLPQARMRRMPSWHQLDRRGALVTMSRTM